jgi:nucleoside-diphosphate-sugar epimerase
MIAAMKGIDCVVHLAGRAHMMQERGPDTEKIYFHSNVLATSHLAAQAAVAGVRRFVYLSSIKVNGESTTDRSFSESDPPAPLDVYGRSKLSAENEIIAVAADTGLETVVIRPPLIYGPGVKANFRSLMQAVECGLPMPLAMVDNRRSLVSLWNLCDLISCCLDHPRAIGETFMVSDGRDMSTSELIRALGFVLNRPARLFPIAPALLRIAGRLLGRGDMIERLIGSLQVDSSKVHRLLDWYPPLSIEEGLSRTGRWYLDNCRIRG